MLNDNISLFDKKPSLLVCFAITLLFHIIVIGLVGCILNNNRITRSTDNMPISENEQIAEPQFIEFVLKDFMFEPTATDIIELIKKEIEIAAIDESEFVVESTEKSTSFDNTMQVTKAMGVEIRQTYISLVAGKLARNKYYPKAEQNRGREGSVKVRFTIEPNGNMRNLMVHTPSRYENLDLAALETVERSSPFPAFDATEPLEIILSIDFSLED